jgi:hypothetical protein
MAIVIGPPRNPVIRGLVKLQQAQRKQPAAKPEKPEPAGAKKATTAKRKNAKQPRAKGSKPSKVKK